MYVCTSIHVELQGNMLYCVFAVSILKGYILYVRFEAALLAIMSINEKGLIEQCDA